MNYAVRKFPGYGKLSGKSLDELRAGERVGVNDDKEDPLDFVLWKAAKPQEPADAKYEGPFGVGRPGWHIECSAMSCALLGQPFDIHGGGMDLQFPHHENEIAQSEGASGTPFVRYWLHNGFLNVDNEKMSKSLGNFFTIRDVLARYDGETLRFFMLRTHYRSPFNFSDANLDDARNALRRLYGALNGLPGNELSSASIDWSDDAPARFKAAMDDDFNTPGAVAVLFELAALVHKASSVEQAQRAAGQLKGLGAVLGVLQQEAQVFMRSGVRLSETEIDAQIAERARAKRERDFKRADDIRAALLAQGIELKDGPQGTTWVRA
jgi:cysteinyl-tRNA synthetase